jgi:hypothetical protein
LSLITKTRIRGLDAFNPEWQSKEASPKKRAFQLGRQQKRRILTNMRLQYVSYR